MKLLRSRLGLLSVVACLVLAGCDETTVDSLGVGRQPRLVLLYAPCSVNVDYLSPYNPEIAYTPNLAAFAGNATVFERHQTEAGVSGIAFASIFSGLDVTGHGVFAHPKRLPDAIELVTEVFGRAGYDTYAWLGHGMASPRLNYAQGVPEDQRWKLRLEADNPVFQGILDRLASDPTYRAFVVTNFTLTHRPYWARRLAAFCDEYPGECTVLEDPAEFARYRSIFTKNHFSFAYDFDNVVARLGLTAADVEKLVAVTELRYKAGIFQLDELFGDVLEAIDGRGLAADSLIAFTADHGELLYRETAPFQWGHSYLLTPDSLRVPLMIRAPTADLGAGRYEGITRSIDVLPTLAGLSGVEADEYVGFGVDLSGPLLTAERPPELLAYSHLPLLGKSMMRRIRQSDLQHLKAVFPRRDPELMWVAVRSGDTVYKLERLDAEELTPSVYDWATDPGEEADLYDADDPRHRSAMAGLEEYRQRLIDAFAIWEDQPDGVSEAEKLELLRSLGYVQ